MECVVCCSEAVCSYDNTVPGYCYAIACTRVLQELRSLVVARCIQNDRFVPEAGSIIFGNPDIPIIYRFVLKNT